MNAIDLIAREAAKPMTHVVVTTYADGASKRFETRGSGQAETWASLERQKIGRDLISRNADFTAGPMVRVVSVEIEAL
mgnify:FL=1|tara:strand:- start:9630 stop:9863 length:234 start_codon:yes stop_codon:yes gene_type:complete